MAQNMGFTEGIIKDRNYDFLVVSSEDFGKILAKVYFFENIPKVGERILV